MANPKLAMIPTGYKAGKVYSVLPESGVGDFTFDRDSKATRVNEDGLIEIMDNDVPRLDYTDGGCPSLLLEPESTNDITYSEDFSQWSNTRSSESVGFTSPDGTNNGTLLITQNDSASNNKYMQSDLFRVSKLLEKSYLSPKQEVERDLLILEIDEYLLENYPNDLHLAKIVTRFKKQGLTF